MHIFIALLVNKWSSSPVKTAVNFKIFAFHLWYFFPESAREQEPQNIQKNHKEQKMELTQKNKFTFSFFFPLFFQWDAASGLQQKLLMRVNTLRTSTPPPSLMNFPLKNYYNIFGYLQLLLQTVTSCLLCQIQRTFSGSCTRNMTNLQHQDLQLNIFIH